MALPKKSAGTAERRRHRPRATSPSLAPRRTRPSREPPGDGARLASRSTSPCRGRPRRRWRSGRSIGRRLWARPRAASRHPCSGARGRGKEHERPVRQAELSPRFLAGSGGLLGRDRGQLDESRHRPARGTGGQALRGSPPSATTKASAAPRAPRGQESLERTALVVFEVVTEQHASRPGARAASCRKRARTGSRPERGPPRHDHGRQGRAVRDLPAVLRQESGER